MSDPRPIGLFDSGIGGLTVLREVQARLPGESTIYIGDSARHPYGTRSDAEVRTFAEELSDELVARGVKVIIIACNTATAAAAEAIRKLATQTKSDDWSYEKEWRLLFQNPSKVENRFYFDKNCIEEITIGYKSMDNYTDEGRELKSKFDRIRKERFNDVPLMTVGPHQTKLELN